MNNSQAEIDAASSNDKAGQEILNNLERLGYSEPSEAQSKMIKAISMGNDVVFHSASERSKLAVFAATVFASITRGEEGIQGIVITAGRERAELMAGFLKQLGGVNGIKITTLGPDDSASEAASSSVIVCSPDSAKLLADSITSSVKRILLLDADSIQIDAVSEFMNVLKSKKIAPVVIVQSATLTPEISRFSLESLNYPQTIALTSDEISSDVLVHMYYEVGPDLLDKTNALFDLLEVEQANAAIVFCNSRSDLEFVDVVLKKKGAKVYKVDDEAQRGALSFGMRSIRQGEASVLLLSDEGAGDLEVNEFDLIVNYSINSEPEVYLHRFARGSGESKLRKVFSLVGPLDYGNFHFIKKVVGVDFVKGDLPSAEALSASRLAGLVNEATKGNRLGDSTIAALTEQINQHEQRDQILALLLHNTINVMPSLRKAQGGAAAGHQQRDQGGDYERRGRDGDSRRGPGGGRGDRDERYGRRGDDRGGRGGGRQDRDDRGGRNRRGRDDGGGDNQYYRNDAENERRHVPLPPPDKEVRLYIGSGSRQGLTQQEFTSMVGKHCGVNEDQIKRFTVRDCYAYADFKEDVAPQVLEKLADASLPSGDKLFIRKAATLVLPREREEGDTNGTTMNAGAEAFENGDSGAGISKENLETTSS